MTASDGILRGARGFRDSLERGRVLRYAGLVVVALSLISVTITFMVLTGLTPIAPTWEVIVVALAINGVLVAILLAGVVYEIYKLWSARSAGKAGARLHVRIVALFSLIATLPALLVAGVATITLSRGLDRWFQERTTAIVTSSARVADAYVDEHARALRGDVIAMANDINNARAIYDYEPARFERFLQAQTSLRLLPSSYLLRRDGTVVVRAVANPDVEMRLPPLGALNDSTDTRPILIAPGDANQVGAVLKLGAYDNLYLYIARPMDPRVLAYLRLTAENAQEYLNLERSRLGVQVAFGLVYAGVTLVLLIAAIWLGFGFANRMVAPIRHLIDGADAVAKGNLRTVVPIDPAGGDLAHLGETFNTMTTQLEFQRNELLKASELIDQRRRFTEAVLSGVSAGVLGVSADGRVSLANRSALDLLRESEAEVVGRPLEEVLPELGEARPNGNGGEVPRNRPTQVTIRRGDSERIVAVRITRDPSEDPGGGFVVTLDDITDLLSAQRTAAWADVARRIAHEIKNPLTPIQLSAERIKRRYRKQLPGDTEVFDQCVETIIRQVGDIGRMVNEFSAFARMPEPVMERLDLREAVREAVFVQSTPHPDIKVGARLPEQPVIASFDPRMVTQAIGNLVKNAAEAIEQTTDEMRGGAPGRIEVTIETLEDGALAVQVVDNGIGLPQQDRHRLLEPYMTTREKGTGLGLAIVRKIAEEHGGRVELLDAGSVGDHVRGACVRFVLPADRAGSARVAPGGGSRSGAGPDAPGESSPGRSADASDPNPDRERAGAGSDAGSPPSVSSPPLVLSTTS